MSFLLGLYLFISFPFKEEARDAETRRALF